MLKGDLKIYKDIYKDIDKNKRIFAEKLYNEAAFMSETLAELKKSIKEDGAVITSLNGNGFYVTSENVAQKSYNTMIKNYNATLKQLCELAPPATQNESKLKALMDDE